MLAVIYTAIKPEFGPRKMGDGFANRCTEYSLDGQKKWVATSRSAVSIECLTLECNSWFGAALRASWKSI
jgi:hypothetical protein